MRWAAGKGGSSNSQDLLFWWGNQTCTAASNSQPLGLAGTALGEGPGSAWFTQLQGFDNRKAFSLLGYFLEVLILHKDKFLFFTLKRNEFSVTLDFVHEENVKLSDFVQLAGSC